MATPIYVRDIYDELPAMMNCVRDFLQAGTTQDAKRHLISAGLIEPLTQAGWQSWAANLQKADWVFAKSRLGY